MANNEFAQSLIEILLSWMRLIASWVWNFFQADMGSGFLAWFADHWISIVLVLIIAGVVIDWLIWMIRWRPYWLWLRKRQIIYEEVEAPIRPKTVARPQPMRHMPQLDEERTSSVSPVDDLFGESAPDPYAVTPSNSDKKSDDFSDWDTENDPYAVDRGRHTDYDPTIYARPAMGESSAVREKRHLPVLNEKKK